MYDYFSTLFIEISIYSCSEIVSGTRLISCLTCGAQYNLAQFSFITSAVSKHATVTFNLRLAYLKRAAKPLEVTCLYRK